MTRLCFDICTCPNSFTGGTRANVKMENENFLPGETQTIDNDENFKTCVQPN